MYNFENLRFVSFMKINKWNILVFYVFQYCFLMIGLRFCVEYSSVLNSANSQYMTSTTVLFTEHIKLLLSLLMCYIYDANCKFFLFLQLIINAFLVDEISIMTLFKLFLPAILYTIQNNLQYTIESSSLFIVLYQFKIISTAVFFSTLLDRKINIKEWLSIICLTFGAILVQASQHEFHSIYNSNLEGITAVIFACLSSGLAGVFFEKILKASNTSIWIINVQLSMLSSMLSMIACLTINTQEIIDNGFVSGYDMYVIAVILMQAITGLAVALVVRYTDNIHKGFATTISIIIAGVTESRLFPNSFEMNLLFLSGAFISILSTFVFLWLSNNQSKFLLPTSFSSIYGIIFNKQSPSVLT